MKQVIRVLVAKPGLDGHDRGAKLIARALRNAGMEVIYTGYGQRPEEVVNTAIQEDVDIIGTSYLSGAHLELTQRIMQILRERNIHDKIVIVGGTIPREDIAELKKMGVSAVFPTGTPVKKIVDFISGGALAVSKPVN